MPKYRNITEVDAIQYENEFEVMAWAKELEEGLDWMKDGECLTLMNHIDKGVVPICNLLPGDYLAYEKPGKFYRIGKEKFTEEYEEIHAPHE